MSRIWKQTCGYKTTSKNAIKTPPHDAQPQGIGTDSIRERQSERVRARKRRREKEGQREREGERERVCVRERERERGGLTAGLGSGLGFAVSSASICCFSAAGLRFVSLSDYNPSEFTDSTMINQ